ncbi:hypothetical protein DPMN_075793 [Dreissena polymorpha]|uniref:Uncharacterized protein n=1 Tax=Dreissena polymorpha TaxID=45954 RepID=A0A9D3YME5_DREPO|nr:hypothetical protein DPMN_075793 [Dreissena polymorpha]
MDITLLTYVLLNHLQVSTQNNKDICELRSCRNELAHSINNALLTDDIFNRALIAMKSICQDLDGNPTITGYGAELHVDRLETGVQELEKQSLVVRVSQRCRLSLCREDMMDKLLRKYDESKTGNRAMFEL